MSYKAHKGAHTLEGVPIEGAPIWTERAPYVKVGNIEIELEDIVHIFGGEVWVREEEQRRDGKHDTPNRQAIYLGESNVVKHGKKVTFIDYDDYQQLWKIIWPYTAQAQYDLPGDEW